MKKEISPEMYNYNKYPGPSFARVGDKVVAENIELDLLADHKQAFDQTAFGQRFSPLMLKFDYIVGDWGNEQLRLKGFYKNDKVVKSDLKIERLDDYLLEHCNFGCAYFVLGNEFPQDLPEEPEDRPRKRRSRNRNRKKEGSSLARESKPFQPKDKQGTRNKKSRDKQDKSREFILRQEKKQDRKPRKQAVSQEQTTKQRNFVIRQK